MTKLSRILLGVVITSAVGTAGWAAGTVSARGEAGRGEDRTASLPVATETSAREVVIPAGTRVQIRLASTYSSASSRVEDRVTGTLASNVRVGGVVVLPAGSAVSGVVSGVDRPGKVKGRGAISLQFTNVRANGENYTLAAGYSRVAPATKGEDAAKIGVPAAGGAIIGGILGGKKGAAAGAAIGGGAGTAVVLSTRGQDATIARGTVLTLTLRNAITVHAR